ncbi:MAG: glycoside hydrolase family 2 protein [Burkholderiales bacterium]|nr:glycoside hydrolase family 2 [Burkholderiales bacterium]MDQ3195911.1 glycoside hydrolase family 2 [Pseudomonadota bacterium]
MQNAYPRPQLQRSRWVSLNGMWKFRFDHERSYASPPDIHEWPHTILVPFAPECKKSGIHDTGFHRACWYQREFEVERGAARVILHFGAVDYLARVWINDMLVVEHEGGHTPFSADITWALRGNGPQRVTVYAEDDADDLEKPRGKQDWQLEPHSIWYPRTTGIWQTVWYECVPETHIDRLRWTPHIERWEIGAEFFLVGPLADDMRIALRLCSGSQVLVDDSYKVINGEVHRRIALSDPGIEDYRNELLWSPERPTLIQAEVRLWRGDELVDEFKSYTALRSVNIQRDRFLLNGRPYQLRLVLDQGYWPETLLTAPSDEALKRDIELAKAMGFNGVRKHQKLEDPRYLFWADTLGLAVWGEMPSAYRFTNKAIKRSMQEWTQAIRRDYSHPCVIVWVPFNESWGVPDLPTVPAARDAVAAFYHLTKTLDQTRPVIGNDGWESSATDIIGIHDYDCNPVNLRARYGPTVKTEELFDRRRPGGRLLTLDGFPHRGQPVMLTEFGGIAYVTSDDPRRNEAWGYTRCDDIEAYETQCLALLDVARTTGMFSGFCYTQFADTFQEANGLLFADRTPKLPLATIAAAVRGS